MRLSVLFFLCATSSAFVAHAHPAELFLQETTQAETDSSQSSVQNPAVTRVLGDFKPTVKAGGYIITQVSYVDREDVSSHGGFFLRNFRAYVNGNVWEHVGYRVQLELSGKPGVDNGPRVLDAYAEWTRHPEWQPRIGQFKRCFGFENPLHLMFHGMGSFAQAAVKLQSLNDRIGEHRSHGRDLGFQMQGDLFPQADGHRLLHYQVGIYNGQGINHIDIDKHKDLIGGLWVMPTKELKIGAFGWDGYYTNEQNPSQTLRRVRYDLGFMYEGAWSARGEYVHSVGGTTKGGATKSDGWYTMVGIPVPNYRAVKIYGRWDCYRDDATRWDDLVTNWGLSANYYLGKNFVFQLNYTHTINRNLVLRGGHFNTMDMQVSARF